MRRPPHIALRPFIQDVWAAEHARPPGRVRFMEKSLPDGRMHLAMRLTAEPIRILDAAHPGGRNYGFGVLGGARASFYSREVVGPTWAIGATLLPGRGQAFLGPSALEFSNRHTPLDDLWGPEVQLLRERLTQLPTPESQLELFELYLLSRLPQARGLHPAVAQALADVQVLDDVSTLVARSGYSHRRFVELFGAAVGLTPKRFARVQRFRRVLARLRRSPNLAWAELALAAGYSDQAHFNREFREFAGLSPQEYRRAAPESPGHVLLDEGAGKKRSG